MQGKAGKPPGYGGKAGVREEGNWLVKQMGTNKMWRKTKEKKKESLEQSVKQRRLKLLQQSLKIKYDNFLREIRPKLVSGIRTKETIGWKKKGQTWRGTGWREKAA